ncbi:hypothetical protein [Serratia proteamaculans]|uniref:Uncharacterized protein n=1 Tax=Serratia proteamaculans TaxID=28151 RepID=A0A5Q2VF47_SERPR|nr:hypothetical protein [Serratia proteamaculans]QGH63018.1 hypothetical protein GHV41_20230 [Serratia proteamaculans]
MVNATEKLIRKAYLAKQHPCSRHPAQIKTGVKSERIPFTSEHDTVFLGLYPKSDYFRMLPIDRSVKMLAV